MQERLTRLPTTYDSPHGVAPLPPPEEDIRLDAVLDRLVAASRALGSVLPAARGRGDALFDLGRSGRFTKGS